MARRRLPHHPRPAGLNLTAFLCFFGTITAGPICRARTLLPLDWGDGYSNVRLSVSAENQRRADERIPLLLDFPAAARGVAASPLLEELHLERYLVSGRIQWVSAGGESYEGARPCDFEWVLSLRRQCEAAKVPFTFHQTGANFKKDGKTYLLPSHRLQLAQARKANIDYRP